MLCRSASPLACRIEPAPLAKRGTLGRPVCLCSQAVPRNLDPPGFRRTYRLANDKKAKATAQATARAVDALSAAFCEKL
jgi:hypothetical protein